MNKKIAVIGDLIIDYYRLLKPKKLSPEAPVVVFSPESEEYRAGGALNVANNIAALGSQVDFFSISGKDIDRFNVLLNSLAFNKVILKSNKDTTIKERLVTKRQQIARIDIQDNNEVEGYLLDSIAKEIFKKIKEYDVIVFVDYAQGMLSSKLVIEVMNSAIENKIPVVVNSKSHNYNKYKGSNILLFNHNEAKEATKMLDFSEDDIGYFLAKSIYRKELDWQMVALTIGSNGINTYDPLTKKKSIYPVFGSSESEVIDVTGAGDTVTAAVAVAIQKDIPSNKIMTYANIAASISVRKMGTSVVSSNEMECYTKDILGELNG